MYLDVRHNIKFRLVVVLLNRHNDSILVTMLLRDSNEVVIHLQHICIFHFCADYLHCVAVANVSIYMAIYLSRTRTCSTETRHPYVIIPLKNVFSAT